MSRVIVVNGNDCYKGVTLRYENVISVTTETLGWTQQWGYEPYGDGVVTKLIGYIGGEGVPPTENIGNYVGINGFVVDISDAVVHSEKGEEGLSAYQVAVKNGFIGTEEEWEDSLQGKDGETIVNINPDSPTQQVRIWVGTQNQYDSQKPLPSDVLTFTLK